MAKGYAKTYGVDYSDTFSSVAKMTFVWLFISLAATHNWDLYQLDIKNVFLHGDLQEEVYMEQPPGFVAQGKIGKACCLRMSLYGLIQSLRAWFGKFNQAIEEFGTCRRVNLITPSSTGTPVQVSFYWWYMWMILLLLGVIL